MSTICGDIETFSHCALDECGAFIYAADPSTDVYFLCYVIDAGPVQVWRPGDSPPPPYSNPTGNKFVWDNWLFDPLIYTHILIPRYGFAPIPLEDQDCAQRLALANAYPAELGLRCEALGLPYRKDQEARKAMLRLSRPLPVKKRKKPEDPAARERDLELLLQRCKTDVESTRAAYNHLRMHPLLPEERCLLLLDAKINARGICSNVPFLEAARALAIKERNAVNIRLNELTAGVVTSVFQVKKIMETVNACGHTMTSLNKRAVAATLAHEPEDFVRELLTLRQHGAFTSTQKIKTMLAFTDAGDHRIRGVLRFHGAGTGRWTSIGAQLHNLPRNDDELPMSLVDAVLAGNYAELARFGNPLTVLAGLMRAVLCAAPGHKLICVDFAAIESRVLAWFANETWKLGAFRQYDASGDERLHPYRRTAAQMLRKDVLAIVKAERQLGKNAELSCGFGGSVRAWRNITHDKDGRSDTEIEALVHKWRAAHPAAVRFWKMLARAARIAIRIKKPVLVAPAPQPPIIAAFDGQTLTLTLPSGRILYYHDARLIPNAKFEDGDPDVECFDNAKGQWKRVRIWSGILTENVVSGTARDLLAAALLRADARGWSIVHHVHDEIVLEAPDGAVAEADVLACMLEPPTWAVGLPLGGKVHSGPIYFEGPATAEPPSPKDEEIVERAVDAYVADAKPLPNTKEIERGAEEAFLASLGDTRAPLTELVSLPMDASRRVSCPFHADLEPSCKIYADHFHCYGCGERGDRVDWLTRVEGLTKVEAIATLQDWSGPAATEQRHDTAERTAFALRIFDVALPIPGTLGACYLADTRGIDVSKLPPTIHEALRFHPNCVFGTRARHPCLIALMRDPLTDAPVGIHRIGLAQVNGKVDKLGRMALGRMGVVKLWPLDGSDQLVVGEGIETVLAAATRIPYRSAALTPAWSTVNSGGMGRLPALPNIKRLILLVDNDENYKGQQAAERCQRIWKSAGRITVPLIPKQKGWDFNDVVLGRKV